MFAAVYIDKKDYAFFFTANTVRASSFYVAKYRINKRNMLLVIFKI